MTSPDRAGANAFEDFDGGGLALPRSARAGRRPRLADVKINAANGFEVAVAFAQAAHDDGAVRVQVHSMLRPYWLALESRSKYVYTSWVTAATGLTPLPT